MKNTVHVSARENNNTSYFYTGSPQIQRLRLVTWQLPSFHYLCKDTSILFTQPLLAQQVFFSHSHSWLTTSILLPQPLQAYNKYSFTTASSGLQVFFFAKASSGSDLNTKLRIYRFGKTNIIYLYAERDI